MEPVENEETSKTNEEEENGNDNLEDNVRLQPTIEVNQEALTPPTNASTPLSDRTQSPTTQGDMSLPTTPILQQESQQNFNNTTRQAASESENYDTPPILTPTPEKDTSQASSTEKQKSSVTYSDNTQTPPA